MKDILLDDMDLQIENGDFVVDRSEAQEVENILMSFKGDFKSDPMVGVGIARKLKSSDTVQGIHREVHEQLQYDGFGWIDFKIEGEDININAERYGT
ncbi:MAG TPA: hypothetical protein VL022_04875 [Moheibacter sp.]|nr:hypothetical protein [Moheibacter sp.]